MQHMPVVLQTDRLISKGDLAAFRSDGGCYDSVDRCRTPCTESFLKSILWQNTLCSTSILLL